MRGRREGKGKLKKRRRKRERQTFQLLSSIKPQALKHSATFCSPRNSAGNILPEETAKPSGHPRQTKSNWCLPKNSIQRDIAPNTTE